MESTHAAPDSKPILESLDTARTAVLEWQTKTESRLAAADETIKSLQASLVAAQSEAATTHRALEATQAELALVKEERDRFGEDCARHQDAIQKHETAARQLHDAVREHQQQLEQQGQQLVTQGKQLEAQVQHSQGLQEKLLELYRDLHNEDLPTVILRTAIYLTHSEVGLFVEADGDGTLASIGLDDLPSIVSEALYRYTREAASAESPVVRNDPEKLPDGGSLINLAALPVAIQSALRGVILVANKRSGPYTDQDTDTLLSVGRHAGVALENRRLHGALKDSFLSTIAVLADAIEAKDPYTRGHCESVAALAVKVARRLGLKGEELDQIRYAALLHDVGKIGVPDGILLKPGKLLEEEFSIIQRHSSIGSDLVSRVPSLIPIAPIILHHHERIDGSGYPDGLGGETISLASRIIGVVDAFDAMTTPRPYREPVAAELAIEELRRCAGGHFDPQVVTAVVEVLSEVIEEER